MKYLYLLLVLGISVFGDTHAHKKAKYVANVVPKNMTIQEKKERFFYLVVPAVKKVHNLLMNRYKRIDRDIKEGKNLKEVNRLKALYQVKSDVALLEALKPHPQSIVIAQAAMESSWGTSRFFVEANNIFGVHSIDPKEPRIAAGEKNGKRTVWLTKFKSINDSVRAYYRTMSISKAFKKFRAVRLQTDDPHLLVKALDRYSEIGDTYAKQLSQVINHNNLTKYDD
ncbi:glucosaminidase domain-containing protein [Sulfurimonas sp. HSL-1716]|uniref:glucosaminidase domain-containing protein n=1 Tax=Hydrocurvibacter sulfurireducens TaxID=3131937 RepID=UPI0031F76A1D